MRAASTSSCSTEKTRSFVARTRPTPGMRPFRSRASSEARPPSRHCSGGSENRDEDFPCPPETTSVAAWCVPMSPSIDDLLSEYRHHARGHGSSIETGDHEAANAHHDRLVEL